MKRYQQLGLSFAIGAMALGAACSARAQEARVPEAPAPPVAPQIELRDVPGPADDALSVQPVVYRRWAYRRPYATGYRWGPGYSPSYRGYYGDYGYYRPRYYRYYGAPRFGYYDDPYGGAARVGPLRFYWR